MRTVFYHTPMGYYISSYAFNAILSNKRITFLPGTAILQTIIRIRKTYFKIYKKTLIKSFFTFYLHFQH